MEPPVRFELTTSALPRRRSVHWSYRGNVPGAGLEPACADFKDRPGCQQPTPEWSRLPVPTRVSCLTRAGPQPCATAGHRRKRWRSLPLHGPQGVSVLTPMLGVLGAIRTHNAQSLRLSPLPLGYEDVEPPSGVEPDHPPYGGEAASRARRRRCRARIRTLTPVAQNHVACLISRPGIECGRRDSDPPGLELPFIPLFPPSASGPPKGPDPVPQGKSLVHHLNACSAWNGHRA